MVTLVITSGPTAGERFEVVGETTLGREDADILLADPELSRRHLAVRPTPAGLEVDDLGSMNGTYINEERISEKVTVGNGAAIRVGQTTFTVEVPAPDPGLTRVASTPPDDSDHTRIQETTIARTRVNQSPAFARGQGAASPGDSPPPLSAPPPPLNAPPPPLNAPPPPLSAPPGPMSAPPGPGNPQPATEPPPGLLRILMRLGPPGRRIAKRRMARRAGRDA